MKKLTQEQEVFAESIGATHYYMGLYWKGGGFNSRGVKCPFVWRGCTGWAVEPVYYDIDDPLAEWHLSKIDFGEAPDMKRGDFQFAVEQLVEYCHNSSILCDELDTVERMLKEM